MPGPPRRSPPAAPRTRPSPGTSTGSTPATTLFTVPRSPVCRPPASSSSRTRNAVSVLPLVPVIPTTSRDAVGSALKAAAAIAARTDSTSSWGTGRSNARSTTSARRIGEADPPITGLAFPALRAGCRRAHGSPVARYDPAPCWWSSNANGVARGAPFRKRPGYQRRERSLMTGLRLRNTCCAQAANAPYPAPGYLLDDVIC
jgi:hypothetical protein